MLQALFTSLNKTQPNRALQGGSHGAQPWEEPNSREIVSTTNDYSHPRVSARCQQQPSVPAQLPLRVAHWSRDSRRQRSQRDSLRRYEGRSGQCAHRVGVQPMPLPIHWAEHLQTCNRKDLHSDWPSIVTSPWRLLVPA